MGQGMKTVEGWREVGRVKKKRGEHATPQQALHHLHALSSFLHFQSDDQIY